MKNTPQLSDLQLAVMRAVWDLGEATVSRVHDALLPERGLAMTTVATLLSRLEKRGLLAHRREGRQFVYRAVASEEEVRREMVEELTDRVFQGDVAQLVSHLLEGEHVDAGELERVRNLIERRVRERGEG